jgi:hypothetical protein
MESRPGVRHLGQVIVLMGVCRREVVDRLPVPQVVRDMDVLVAVNHEIVVMACHRVLLFA